MRAARFVGHYVNVLATGSVLWMIVSAILFDSLHIDLGFILAFWIGVSLLNGRPWSRKVTLILFSLGILFAAGYLVRLIWATGPVSSGQGTLRTPLLASIHGGIILLLLLPPTVLLLLPGTRRWFAEQREAPPSYSLNLRVILWYVLAACVPIAGSIALERATRTAERSGWTTSFSYGGGKIGTAAAGWMEDKETGRRLFVAWLAFGESDSIGRGHDGYITFGPHRIAVPDTKPVKYLGPPPRDEGESCTVILVRADGTEIRLARRVAPDQLEAARAAVDGVRDMDEARKRLETMFPSAEVASGSTVPKKK